MDFDFSTVKPRTSGNRPIEPIELFQSLKVTDSEVKDLWLAQGDALRGWHSVRSRSDVSVALNTGAGKTLIGLLMAQSLVNESRGFVVYACSSIQLVKQTEEKAIGYGIPTTTYVEGSFNNDLADGGIAPCLTTYQALLNGRSRFKSRDIAAMIFDDAHVAENLIRNAFTVDVMRNSFQSTYHKICNLFAEYFGSVDRTAAYREIVGGTARQMLLVPPVEVKRSYNELLTVLQESEISDHKETGFAWQHIKDHLDMCAILLHTDGVTITPPFLPTRTLPYFTGSARRLYLSASLSTPDTFARAFGRLPDCVISPTTTIGECERLVLSPLMIRDEPEQIAHAKAIFAPYKTLILVPSGSRAKLWTDVATLPETKQVTDAISSFKSDTTAIKLLLTSRYDGVDLPGNACRVMVIDDLPSGAGYLERFLWEYLLMKNSLRSMIACRIAQSFGRISRGLSDHGVVIISGKSLLEWLRVRRNISALPIFIQKQIQLGFDISKKMTSQQLVAAPAACLERNPGWIASYTENMQEIEVEEKDETESVATELALAEAKYAQAMWRRDYSTAARELQKSLEKASIFSDNATSWYALWAGYATDLGGDEEMAMELYKRASGSTIHLPRLRPRSGAPSLQLTGQETEIVARFGTNSSGRPTIPKGFDEDIDRLSTDYSPAQVEQALKQLGFYLGLTSTRPDKEFGTGPDVLWQGGDKLALCLEAKSGKKATVVYSKVAVGQLSNHIQWVKDNTDATKIVPCFVGPVLPASDKASPSDDMMVLGLNPIAELAGRVRDLYHDVATNSTSFAIGSFIRQELDRRGLAWPRVIESINLDQLRSIK